MSLFPNGHDIKMNDCYNSKIKMCMCLDQRNRGNYTGDTCFFFFFFFNFMELKKEAKDLKKETLCQNCELGKFY